MQCETVDSDGRCRGTVAKVYTIRFANDGAIETYRYCEYHGAELERDATNPDDPFTYLMVAAD